MSRKKYGIGAYTIDGDYRILYCNQAVRDMYPEVEIGRPCYEVIALKDSPCEICPLHTGSILLFSPERGHWSAATAAEVEIPGYGLCRNVQYEIREQEKAEKASIMPGTEVQEHIEGLRGDTSGAAICSYCRAGSPIFFANEEMASLLGYDAVEELLSRCNGMATNLMHPEDRDRVRTSLRGINQPGMSFETAYRSPRRDGSWSWLVIRGKVVEMPDGQLATVSICADMNDFLQRHEMLRMANQDLVRKEFLSEAIQENMPSGYHRCAMDPYFTFLYLGRSFEEVIGWTREEIETRFHNRFAEMIHPEDQALCAGIIQEIAEKGRGNAIYRLLQKDGRDRWFSDSTMRVDLGNESFYQGTLTDVTDYVESIRQQTRELAAAKAEAEASNRAKSTFLFNLSHDIRTPMNAIKGFSQIIEKDPGNELLVRDAIAKIGTSSDVLMKLLNDVLEISRIESGKERVEMAPVMMDAIAERMRLMFAKEIADQGIRFEMENAIRDQRVWCDELKLIQIGMNMLSNARKFTPRGGRITFGIEQIESSRPDWGLYRFYVRDTGIGMSEEFQGRAFDQFEREHTATNSGVSGSGLGMSIIKRLTELMGGQCTLRSELGKGTEVAAVIPLRFASGKDEDTEQVACDPSVLVGKRVLLAEDSPFNREIARYLLEELGIQVEEAENGRIAVDMLMQAAPGTYDIVLMDIQMPVMDGCEATTLIRRSSREDLASIPIIAMTANAFKEDREHCLQTGMNDHIGKPVDASVLAHTLAAVIEKKEQH